MAINRDISNLSDGFVSAPPLPISHPRFSQRIPNIRIGAQRRVRGIVFFAGRAGEYRAHRNVVALARGSLAYARFHHRQAGAAQDFRDAVAQIGAGVAHRRDLEAAGKLEALAFVLLDVVQLAHRSPQSEAAGAAVLDAGDTVTVGAGAVVMPVPWWNHNRIASHRRLKKPPCGASFNTTSGSVTSGLPSNVTFSVPTFWPFWNGATSVVGISSVALSWS